MNNKLRKFKLIYESSYNLKNYIKKRFYKPNESNSNTLLIIYISIS